MKTTLQALLDAGGTIIADGAMGSLLFSMGLERGASPELWNVEQPDKVASAHRAYLLAGTQVILTNTFGGTRPRLATHGLGDRVAELNRAAAQIAKAEVEAAPHLAAVAGDIGPTGQMLEPLGELTFDEAAAAFEEQARALVEGGVSALWIETMSDLEEVRAAVEGCRRAAPDLPLIATMTFDTKGRTMMGVTPEKALRTLSEFNLVALGANCGNGPDELEAALTKMHAAGAALPLVAKANAGIPRMQDGETIYDATPADMAGYAVRVRGQGARIIGACCGSTPAHIQAIAEALK
jgi:5-methyltetrahydrofolate--homocysteine methyltransferase